MLSEEKSREIFHKVMKYTRADETEVLISAEQSALTRFANNVIHQNVVEEGVSLSVRTTFGKKTGRATTNKLDDPSIRQVVKTSMDIAKVSQEDPDYLPMLGPQEYRRVKNFYSSTTRFGPGDRTAALGAVINPARKRGLSAAGIFSNNWSVGVLANSNGLSIYDNFTTATFSTTITAADSSGYVNISSPNVEDLDVEKYGQIAIDKALKGINPQTVEPGKYTVILEPQAVADLMSFIIFGNYVSSFSGQAAEIEKRSYLTAKLGQKLFGDNITIVDDVYHPLHSGLTYDFEGVPRQRVVLVENGVVKNFTYSRTNAKKLRKEPTGHGLPVPNTMGSAPLNVVVEGGDNSLEAMIASTEKGILTTRFWYIRQVDFAKVGVTGMTRDGTFYIENGRIKYGIKNLRFNQSLIKMLNNVVELSKPVRVGTDEFGYLNMVVPAMKVRDFNFSSLTKF